MGEESNHDGCLHIVVGVVMIGFGTLTIGWELAGGRGMFIAALVLMVGVGICFCGIGLK